MRGMDLVKAAGEPGKGVDVGVDGRPAQILEQVVMQMDAVQTGLAWVHLLQIGEIVVDEMMKWLGRTHH